MPETSRRWPAYALSMPALVFYGGLLAVPLVATLLLSLRVFDAAHVTWTGLGVMNYLAVLGDPYFHTIFARTFGLAAIVTVLSVLLGTPEAIILSRMRAPWRSLCLVAILAPFLISVVVRTLGWAVLLGSPTNMAFGGKDFDEMYFANLARTTITCAKVGRKGQPVANQKRSAK